MSEAPKITMPDAALRQAFEAWARPRLFNMRRIKHDPDQYLSLDTECGWQSWQAAYVAGMEAAAQIADEQARQEEIDNGAASTGGAAATADAIRAAIRRAAEGAIKP